MAGGAGERRERRNGAHQPGADAACEGTGRALRNPAAADERARGRAGRKGEPASGKDGVRMEVKAGYKQTDIGIIPEDWSIELLINCCNYVDYRGKTPHKTSSGMFLITARNIRKGFIDYDVSREYVSIAEYDFTMSRGKPQLGDVLITTEAPLGNVAQVDRENVALAQRIIKYRPKDLKLSAKYLKYYLLSDRFQTILDSRSSGSTAKGIKGSVLHQLPVVIPLAAEQRAIAEALSDADALIDGLEQLIAKKRQVKQGAMQELLTGKSRLPGFSVKWETKKLGDLCTAIMDGTHFTPKYTDNGIPFYSVENVTANNFTNTKFISLEEHNRLIKRCKPEKGDILMTRIGSLGNTKLIDWDVNASIYVSLALLKVNKQAVNESYLYCYTKSRQFREDVELRSLVNAIPQKINMAEISGVPVWVPSLPEQTAIAEVLNEMDAEIAALEGKLVKARQVKQGMMQELLTGKIRLM